jgi:mono/diheme cytochrome c family protein
MLPHRTPCPALVSRLALPVVTALALFIGAPVRAGIEPGEILIGEMNCAACHEPSAQVKVRLDSRQAPKLGAAGLRLTPQWLRAFLENPQGEEPGTLMPDLLAGLEPAERAEAAEALTHYLVSLHPTESSSQIGVTTSGMETGKALYDSVGCAACHAPAVAPAGAPKTPAAQSDFEQLQKSSVPLGDLAKKTTVAELASFLRNPLKTRPSGRMPSLKLSESEATAIAIYLLRDQVPGGKPARIQGIGYEYYEKNFPELPEFDRLQPNEKGSADTFTLSVAKRKNDYGIRFQAILSIPKDGEYTFYTSSDDGSRLFIDDQTVVENGGIHPDQERNGKIKLSKGDHNIRVIYFDGGGNTALKVTWKGPGIKKEEIPTELLSHEGLPMVPTGDAPFAVDPAKAARGKELFASLNCAACHQIDAPGQKAKPLARLLARQPSGCLGIVPKKGIPKFEISDRQRVVILAQLGAQDGLTEPLTPAQQIIRTMTTLNCYACHNRDRRGGPEGLRREYFTTAANVDLGDEGRIPPNLNGVGAKLRPEWIKTVLTAGGAVRPYMATRMPQFGAGNVGHLPDLFEKADAKPDALPQPDVFAPGVAADANKFGRRLVGVGGLTCIACHMFAGNPSLGAPALDLATAGERLKWDWFRRYLLDPQALRPGTRMPAFWPNGVAANRDILDGDAEKQIFAIWGYLARKNFTDLPNGLVQGKQEIVADKEAVMYRNFIEGAGSRAIGVGYPEKANVAFDANDMRLALIWQGAFIDAARHRTGRGQGFEKPLGVNVVQGPPGAPLAVLDSESAEWPKDSGKLAGWQFRGYSLDNERRPTFRYSWNGIDIQDFPEAVPGNPDAGLRRTVSVHSTQPISKLYFRVAIGDKIEEKDGAFIVDEKLKLKFTGVKAMVRNSEGKAELLVPLTFAGNDAKFVEEMTW